jgi:endonuclease-3 related protein
MWRKRYLFLKRKGSLTGALLSCPRRRLAQSIRSAGYYNVKSVRLKNFLKFFSDSYSSDISRMGAQEPGVLRNQLLGVGGIGPETADSIMLYALGKPVFVIDAYTKRIFSRHRILKGEATYAQAQDIFMRNLAPDSKMFNEYHALLVKVGKDYCRKHNPKCQVCPLHGQ